MGFNKKRSKPPKNRKTKKFLVFDEQARADYLTGFRKRKAERKKYAEEKMKKKLKEERKHLKTEAREVIKKRMNQQSVYRVPEVEHLVDATEFDLPNHTVTITDITDVDFSSEGGLRLGQNVGGNQDETVDEDTKESDEKKLNKLKRELQRCGNPERKKSKLSLKHKPNLGKKNRENRRNKKKKKKIHQHCK